MAWFDYVDSRRKLKELVKERLISTYDSLSEEQELEGGQTQMKTYLIESNRDIPMEGSRKIGKLSTTVESTSDSDFRKLIFKTDETREAIFIDALSDRFWAIHTLANTYVSDRAISDLVFPRFTQLDHSWLSNGFLESISQRRDTDMRAFSVKYDDEFKDLSDDIEGVRGLSMRLWGETAKDVLSTLRQEEKIRTSTSLSNVGIRRKFGDKTLLSDINYQSKFTVRGESVEGHFKQLREIMSKYYDTLSLLEEKYSIRRNSPSDRLGTTIDGEPVFIEFKRSIEDLEGFIDELFSAQTPFRIWGVKLQESENYYSVSAVDMHTGDELDFEVTPNWIRIYLDDESCGNTIIRTFTNLQHFFDSEAELRGDRNETILN